MVFALWILGGLFILAYAILCTYLKDRLIKGMFAPPPLMKDCD